MGRGRRGGGRGGRVLGRPFSARVLLGSEGGGGGFRDDWKERRVWPGGRTTALVLSPFLGTLRGGISRMYFPLFSEGLLAMRFPSTRTIKLQSSKTNIHIPLKPDQISQQAIPRKKMLSSSFSPSKMTFLPARDVNVLCPAR